MAEPAIEQTGARGENHGRPFVVLDGLRGMAAPIVVLFHAGVLMGVAYSPYSGYLAVDLFFVLSGFVIAYAYDARFAAGMTWPAFLIRRVIRFYPLYLTGLALGLVALAGGIATKAVAVPWTGWITMLPQLVFLPGFRASVERWTPTPELNLFALNPAAYTLFAELAINLFYAFFWRRLTLRVLTLIVAVLGALVLALFATGHEVQGVTFGTIGVLPLRVGYGFLLGALLFRLWGLGWRAPATPAFVLFTLTVILLWPHWAGPARSAYDGLFVLLLSPALVWFGASATFGPLVQRLGAFAGQVSYAVYILHEPLTSMAVRADEKLLGGRLSATAPLAGLAFLAGLVVFAWAMDVWFDVPIRNRLTQRFLSRRRRESPAS